MVWGGFREAPGSNEGGKGAPKASSITSWIWGGLGEGLGKVLGRFGKGFGWFLTKFREGLGSFGEAFGAIGCL